MAFFDASRRSALSSLAMLPTLGSLLVAPRPASAQTRQPASSSTLVVYFSRTGNTRVIANQIRRAHAADMFEIVPASPYPEDYELTVGQARRETESGYEPPLQDNVRDMPAYSVIFLGFPIWGQTAPPVIRAFLSAHDLGVKTLVPFITHGGFGLGSSLSVVDRLAPKARLIEGFAVEADQERRTLSQVTSWLGGLPL